MMKIGQQVIWIANDPAMSPMKKRVFEGTVTKLGRDTVYVNNAHRAEDQLYASFVFPDVPEARELLEKTLAQAARHVREDDDLMKETMQAINKFVREGLK